MYSIFGSIEMLSMHLIATSNQRVLYFLAKFSDKDFYEREVARKLGIGYGSANRALHQLYTSGALKQRQSGKMHFYSIDSSIPAIIEFKKLVNMMLVEPLVEQLKSIANRIVLYGSCAQGIDTSESDLDLFIVSSKRKAIIEAVNTFTFPPGFEDIHIQSVVKSNIDLIQTGESERVFIAEVERGITLWERATNESRI